MLWEGKGEGCREGLERKKGAAGSMEIPWLWGKIRRGGDGRDSECSRPHKGWFEPLRSSEP